MSIFVKSTVNEITVRNKIMKCKFFPLTGRFSIISPEGALTNVFPLIFVENESITLLEDQLPNLAPKWNVKKTHPTLTAFFPRLLARQKHLYWRLIQFCNLVPATA